MDTHMTTTHTYLIKSALKYYRSLADEHVGYCTEERVKQAQVKNNLHQQVRVK